MDLSKREQVRRLRNDLRRDALKNDRPEARAAKAAADDMRVVCRMPDGTVAIVIPTAEGLVGAGTVEALVAKSCRGALSHRVVAAADVPTDRVFRNAWEDTDAGGLHTSVPKARVVAHDVRRATRSRLMAPLDIKATIPSEAGAAENDRQTIRNRNDRQQSDIDGAGTVGQIRTVIDALIAE